jgi:hypothetical protein
MFAPRRSCLGAEMFFVRVNRFWCVWTRVLVIADAVMCLRKPARVFGNGLSDLEAGVKS